MTHPDTDLLPLTGAQEGLWFANSLFPSGRHWGAEIIEIRGPIDVGVFRAAVAQVLHEAEAARVRIVQTGRGLRQSVGDAEPVRVVDITAAANPLAAVQAWFDAELDEPVDLAAGPNHAVVLFTAAHDQHFWLQKFHHCLLDGFGNALLTERLAAVYTAMTRGELVRPTPFPPLRSLVDIDTAYRGSPRYAQDRQYWSERLRDRSPAVSLSSATAAAAHPTANARVVLDIPPATAAALRAGAEGLGVRWSAFAFTAVAAYLHRHTGVQDVVVGMAVKARNFEEARRAPAMLSNVVPLRLHVDGRATLREAADATSRAMTEALAHQRYDFAQLQRDLGVVNSRSPIFRLIVNILSFHQPLEFAGHPTTLHDPTNFPAEDMTILIHGHRSATDGMRLIVDGNAALYRPDEIAEHADRFLRFLTRLAAADPDAAIGDVAVLGERERERVLVEFNDSATPVPEVTLPVLLTTRAADTPEAVAVVGEDRQLTYAELDACSNRLARVLIAEGVAPDVIVAVALPRSVDLVVALVAVLKAGGAYLPVDLDHPAGRVDVVLADNGAAVVLTAGEREFPGRTCLRLDDADLRSRLDVTPAGPVTDAERHGRLLPDHLAYVMPTSGSTGRPKNVEVTHRGLVNFFAWMQDRYRLTTFDRVLHSTPLSFDPSVSEIFWPLLEGARIVLARPGGHRDPGYLMDLIHAGKISVAQTVPSMLRFLLATPRAAECTSLRMLVLGGEKLPSDLRDECRRVLGVAPQNIYGATELSVAVTIWSADRERDGDVVPVGGPGHNTRVFVLDADLRPVPIGVTGEIFVVGPQVARGYRRSSATTAARFVACPFVAGARMYRIGDQGRWTPDGTLVIAGRSDDQVKIRGIRVEPGEVETVLAAHPAVDAAVVLARPAETGGLRLVAYVVPSRDGAPGVGAAALREHVSHLLPEQLVPSAFVVLDVLPLTANGKVDRGALPEPEHTAADGDDGRGPVDIREEILCAAFAEVLRLDVTNVHDSFFDLGGHSLLAVQLIERLRERGMTIDIPTLFGASTVASLAAVAGRTEVVVPPTEIPDGATSLTPDMVPLAGLSAAELESVVSAVAGGATEIADIYPLGPLQEGFFFHHQLAEGEDASPYVSPFVWVFDSVDDRQRFLDSWQQVVARHDVLRTGLEWAGLPHPVQVVRRHATIPVSRLSVTAGAAEGTDAVVARLLAMCDGPLDLHRAPLIAAHVADLPERGQYLVVLRASHIILDHPGLDVVLREADAIATGHGDTLPPPKPYRTFVGQARLGVPEEEHRQYFARLLGDVTDATAPFGVLDVREDKADAVEVRLTLDAGASERLRAEAKRCRVSPATVFHVVWTRVLSALTGGDDVVFGTLLLGRMLSGAGSDRVPGLFLNTLPVRARVGSRSVRDSVRAMQAQLAELVAHEHASLPQAQRASGVPWGTPLFTTLLNYRHLTETNDAERRLWPDYWRDSTNYPLAAAVNDAGPDEPFVLMVQAVPQIDARMVAELFLHTAATVAEALASRPEYPLAGVDVLAPGLRELVVRGWNDTAGVVSSATVAELFAARVAANRDAVAVVSGGESVTFGELAARSDRLASCLVAVGVGPEARVAVVVPRSVEMVVALLGVWKAGGVYVPVDPEYPARRIGEVLVEVAPVVTVVARATADIVAAAAAGVVAGAAAGAVGGRVVVVDEPWGWGSSVGAGGGAGGARLSGQNAAYVIYTSGSTGRPKGVVVSQAAVVNLLGWMQQRYGLTAADRVLQKTPITFDASVWEVFWPLVQGAAVVLARPGGQRDPDHLVEVVCRERVTVAQFVPSALEMFLAAGGVGECTGLRLVFAGGEILTPQLARQVRRLPHAALVNLYGPTETVVQMTAFEVVDPDAIRIGRSATNTRVYVLDATLEPVPPGVTGELYVGGVQLARGYLNRPDLTATRFVADPFTPGQRLYRTGDTMRWSAEGMLQFVGRADDQINLRGFRIEPGEIETVLATCPAVRRAVVTAREDTPGDRRLVAYLLTHTPHPDHTTIVQIVLAHARTHLPEHMVPTTVVLLDDLPTTTTGKLDRRALPTPPRPTTTTTAAARPATAREEALCAAFAEILTLPAVTTTDNFFDLGGHSLLATRLTNRIRTLLGIDLTVRTVFEHPTPERLAAALTDSTRRVRPRPQPAASRPGTGS